jgi:hypothetical protein
MKGSETSPSETGSFPNPTNAAKIPTYAPSIDERLRRPLNDQRAARIPRPAAKSVSTEPSGSAGDGDELRNIAE